MRKPAFSFVETKTQISLALTAQLISTFVLATWKVQFLLIQESSLFVRLYMPFFVGPDWKLQRQVSQVAAH